MSFNPDITKQAEEIIFPRKKKKWYKPFNTTRIQRQSVQKHLGLFLDEKLSRFWNILMKK